MALDDLATGIAIDFTVGGFDILLKLPKTLDAANASTSDLILSVKGLGDAFTGLIGPMSAATDGLTGFAAAARGASRAARSVGADTVAGMRGTGNAARQAKADMDDLRTSILAVKAAASDFNFTGGFGGGAARRASTQSVLGVGSGLVNAGRYNGPGYGTGETPLSGGFNRSPSARIISDVASIGSVAPLALNGGGGIGVIPPTTGNAYRMPSGGGGGGGNIGGYAAAAAAGGAGGGGFGAIAGLGAGLAGRGMPLLAQVGKVGLDVGLKAAKIGSEIGLGIAVDGILEASKMDTLMLGIRNSTGASNTQVFRIRQSAYDVGAQTNLSANEAAQGIVNIARASGGVFRNKNGTFDEGGFSAIVPTVLKAAEIQHLTRGTDVGEASTTMMEIVHLFRDFKGTPFTKLADLITRVSEATPTSQKAALRQFTAFEPQFKTLGISDTDAMASYAMLARAGYGQGKGGTNINDLIGGALPALELTRHAQSGKLGLLEKYGFVDRKTGKSEFFTNDKADLMGFYRHIAELGREYSRDDLVTSFKSMFGVQGGRIANLVSDPQINAQLTGIKALMNDPQISLNAQFKGYQNTFGFQSSQAGKDFQSLTGELMSSSLPGLTRGFRDLGDALHGGQRYLHEHKEIENRIKADVIGMVSGTENFLVSHRKGFQDLGSDLNQLWTLSEKAGPTVNAVASGLLILTEAAAKFTSAVVGGPLGVLFRTVEGIEHPHETLNVAQRAAAARALAANGGRPLPPPPPPTLQPVTGLPGQRAAIMRENAAILAARPITIVQNFHGPANPRSVGAAARAAVEATRDLHYKTGTVVTSPRVPSALTVGSR